jgi:hypothetical protein
MQSAMAKRRKPAPAPLWVAFDTEYELAARRNDILCYSYGAFNPDTGLTCKFIFHVYPDWRNQYVRLTLGGFLSRVIRHALKEGVVQTYPRSIVMVAHFTRADLSMFADFHSDLKRRLRPIRGTLVTSDRRLAYRIPFPDGERRVTISVIDTLLISPDKTSLASLSDYVDLPKLEIMAGYAITAMKRYRDEQPQAFDEYAGRDPLIALRYAISYYEHLKKLGISGRPPTVAAAGVALLRGLFRSKTDRYSFFGQEVGPSRNKRHQHQVAPHLQTVMAHAALCYHGGLNDTYYVGYSPPGKVVSDADLAGAYPTGLAATSWPDWSSVRYTKSLADHAVIDEAMTFAHVRFKFPDDTKHPCLPVRSGNQHGLVFPLEGEAWVCGPELVVALAMGAKIDVVDGYRVEWSPGRANPLTEHARINHVGRTAALAAGQPLLAAVHKLLANSLYGKISQGVGSARALAEHAEDHRIFHTATGEMEVLPPCSITCAPIAAWATSFVRATMSETLHRMPPTSSVLQATTDGILFIGSESDLNTSGPVAQAFKRARARVTGETDPQIWIIKHRLPQVIVVKTRGLITVVTEDWAGDVHLAKAGARLPEHLKTEVERTRYAEQFYRGRDYDTKFTRGGLVSLREQFETGCDLVSVGDVEVALNWDCDFKNKPVEPVVDVEGVISFYTRPWRTIDEFEDFRKNFDDWRRFQRRVLKSSSDHADMLEWIALRPTRKTLRTNSRGVLPNLAIAIVAIAVRRPMRERKPYKEIAQILARATGRVVTEQHVKDIRRKRDQIPDQCVSQLSRADIEFARRYGTNPIAIAQLGDSIVPGSIAERQFAEIWERGLERRVLKLAPPEPWPWPEPQPDLALVYRERIKLRLRDLNDENARLQAYDDLVAFVRTHRNCDHEEAKRMALAAMKPGAAP